LGAKERSKEGKGNKIEGKSRNYNETQKKRPTDIKNESRNVK
jgi:hypothetical protein